MPKTRRCGNCREKGHYASKCPQSVNNNVTALEKGGDATESPDVASDPSTAEGGVDWVHLNIDAAVLVKFREIVNMCTAVAGELKKGFAESVYEEALCFELQERHISYTQQEVIPITYKGKFVGVNRSDIILHDWLPLVIEAKAMSSPIKTDDRWQVIRYMERKSTPYGVVVNFSQSIKGRLAFSFIVKHDSKYYQYNPVTGEGLEMLDFGL